MAGNIFTSPDLWQGADQLNFEIHKNMNPKNDFVILDIDHFLKKQGDFESSKIMELIKELHDDLYIVFCDAVTKDALNDWK